MNSSALWLMDSEYCCECGTVLGPCESTLCDDCQQDRRYDEDQDYYDGWFSNWDVPEEREREAMTVPIKNALSVMSIPKIFEVITKTLVKHKAKSISYTYDQERISAIEFELDINGHTYPFRLPARVKSVEKILYGTDTRFLSKTHKEQAYRVAWANIRDWVTAQCALIDTDMVRAEEIFLPYMVARNGRTYFEVMIEQQFLLPDRSEGGQ